MQKTSIYVRRTNKENISANIYISNAVRLKQNNPSNRNIQTNIEWFNGFEYLSTVRLQSYLEHRIAYIFTHY